MTGELEENIISAAELLDAASQDQDAIRKLTRDFLLAVGEDPEREGLLRTPDRVARMMDELLAGYRTDPVKLLNDAIFEMDTHQMVLVRDIDFYSMCEHHLLPFIGRAHVAYIPNGRIVGLSKIPRVVDMFARRFQVQERMTNQIANFINEVLTPAGVAVLVEGMHLCAIARGVHKREARMTTSVFLGKFEADPNLRAEFLDSVRSAHPQNW